MNTNSTPNMKPRQKMAPALGVGFLLAIAGNTHAQTTTWYGVNNNSAAAGATGIDAVSLIANTSWHDANMSEASPNLVSGNDLTTQVRGTKTGIGAVLQVASVFRWDGLNISDSVSSASYFFNVEFLQGGANTYYITPIAPGAGAWDEDTATWGNLDPFIDYSATTGGFTVSSTGWMSLDVTSLMEDYRLGNNAGFAMVRDVNVTSGQAPYFTQYTSESLPTQTPGLRVTTVPEPSVALLGGLSAMLLFRRRR